MTADLRSPLRVELAPAAEAAGALDDERVVAVIGFGADSMGDAQDPRRLTLALPQLLEAEQIEIWRADRPARRAWDGPFGIAETDELMFARLVLEEDGFEGLAETTGQAYRLILELLRRRGYPHLLRIWHYFPAITGLEQGLERYQAFCLGRHAVLEPLPDFERSLPAATAIGTRAAGFVIYLLAARSPGRQVENPRQVSAFRYPRRYSPRSPSFSRATLKRWGAARHLYISGTASIVGHESRHCDDAAAQLDEILRNLDALLEAARGLEPQGIRSVRELSLLKVYLREAEQAAALRERLAERLGGLPPTLFLQGEVCRRELALEIEAWHQHGPED